MSCFCIDFTFSILLPSYEKNIKFCFSSVLKSKPRKNQPEGSCKFRAIFQHYSMKKISISLWWYIFLHIIIISQQCEHQKCRLPSDEGKQTMFYCVIPTAAEINTVCVIWPAESSEAPVVNGMNDSTRSEEKTWNLHESAGSTSTGTNREKLKLCCLYLTGRFWINAAL